MALIDSSDVELRIAASTSGQQQVATLAAELDTLADKGGEAAPQLAALASELRKLDNQQSLIQQFAQLKKETGEAGKALEDAQTRAQKLGREFAATENPSRKLTNEFNRSRKEVKEAATALQQKQLALQNVRGALNTAGLGTTDLAQKQAGLRTALESATTRARDMGTRMTSTGRETAGAGREIEKAGKASETTGKKIEQAGKEAERTGGIFSSLRAKVAGVATAIAGYFGVRMFSGAISSAADFEEQMDKVGAVTRAAADEQAKLRAAADRAGTETRYTATEAAQALENLARAGFSASESVAALPAVLGLAQANSVELAEASSLVTRAVRGMGLEVAESGRVADVLTRAAQAANTNVTGLGQALAYAAPTAQALGLSLEQTVAIIGKFADAGVDASRAGTALNSIMAQFSNPASKFRQELAAAGITTTDFWKALDELAAAGPRGAGAIIAVGQEAGPALRALLNQGIDSLNDLRGALDGAGGAAAEAAAVMDGNLRGATRGFQSAWDAARRALVEPLLEPLSAQIREFAGRLRDLVSSGSITSFGQSAAEAFGTAAKWVTEFIEKADFSGIKRSLDEFAASGREQLGSLGASFGRAADQITFVVNTFKAGGSVVMGVLYKIAEAFAGVASNIISLAGGVTDVLARMIPIDSISERMRALVADIQTQAGAIWAVSEAFAQQSSAMFESAVESSSKAADAWGRLNTAVQATTASTAAATAAEAAAAEQATLTADQLDKLGAGYEFVDGQARKATAAVNANSDAAKGNAAALGEATAKTQEVAAAYQRLGVESSEALKQAAINAKRDFDIIRDSGTASARDIELAFRAYAEKAIAANRGVASAVLEAEAAQNGLSLAANESGRVTVEAMHQAADATARLRSEAEEAASAVSMIGAAADEASAAVAGMSAANKGASGGGSSGGFSSPLANLLPRAEQVGGLAFRKEIEALLNDWSRRQSPVGTISGVAAKMSELWNLANDRIEEEQMRREAEGSRFGTGPQRAAATPQPGGSYSVSVSFDGSRRTINAASDADARALIELLQEFERRTAA